MPTPVVNRFARAMMERLSANKHKGGWRHEDQRYLTERLQQEVDELFVALAKGHSAEEIRKECADVGNFAMMIADNHGDLKSL